MWVAFALFCITSVASNTYKSIFIPIETTYVFHWHIANEKMIEYTILDGIYHVAKPVTNSTPSP
jgi:hypothetical protein